jgi:hypothetical protein
MWFRRDLGDAELSPWQVSSRGPPFNHGSRPYGVIGVFAATIEPLLPLRSWQGEPIG